MVAYGIMRTCNFHEQDERSDMNAEWVEKHNEIVDRRRAEFLDRLEQFVEGERERTHAEWEEAVTRLGPDAWKDHESWRLGRMSLLSHDGQPLDELNFSVNAKAAATVLSKGKNISIITGNNCLPVSALPKDEFLDNLCSSENPAGMYIAKKCGYRFFMSV